MLKLKCNLTIKNTTPSRAFRTEWYRQRLESLIRDNALAEVIDLTVSVEEDTDEYSYLSKKRRDYVKNSNIKQKKEQQDKERVKQYREQLKKGNPGGIDSEGNRYFII